jgi:hypothetical protein
MQIGRQTTDSTDKAAEACFEMLEVTGREITPPAGG